MPTPAEAMDEVRLSVDRFCLLAGIEALAEMMEEDATAVCGARHRRHGDRRGYRWGHTQSEIGYHGGRVKVARPRVRDRAGKEVSLESWEVLCDGDLLFEWALNLMVLNVSTRKYRRAVRLEYASLALSRGCCGAACICSSSPPFPESSASCSSGHGPACLRRISPISAFPARPFSDPPLLSTRKSRISSPENDKRDNVHSAQEWRGVLEPVVERYPMRSSTGR